MPNSFKHTPLGLFILDGLALNPETRGNAVHHARTPTLDRLLAEYPNTTLIAHSESVGLPEGQMGNSEVGHLNIGAGRVVMQELSRINKAVKDKALAAIPALKDCFQSDGKDVGLHLVGLASKGGVHSELGHLKALIKTAVDFGVENIFIHAATDGRDCPPETCLKDLEELSAYCVALREQNPSVNNLGIASVVGRYFAMDRDKRWDRTRKAYELYTERKGQSFPTAIAGAKDSIENGCTDEFIEPIVVRDPSFSRDASILDGDTILFFNFRADRARQMLASFLNVEETKEVTGGHPPAVRTIGTLTEYDAELAKDARVKTIFAPLAIENHLGQVLAAAGTRQLRIAETEKYPHVTYFFNGGDEEPVENEYRILINSPRDVPTYDLKPEMSAHGVTEALLKDLQDNKFDVAICNFANCDMVGHTGVFDAAVKAVETVDSCMGQILEELLKAGGTALITADHGNADQMIDYQDESPHTYHTLHPVPLILASKDIRDISLKEGGSLCDIAPTILELLEIPKPQEMTGSSLIAST